MEGAKTLKELFHKWVKRLRKLDDEFHAELAPIPEGSPQIIPGFIIYHTKANGKICHSSIQPYTYDLRHPVCPKCNEPLFQWKKRKRELERKGKKKDDG